MLSCSITINNVVRPAAGNASGTLVNGLQHCSLLTAALPEEELLSDTEDVSDDEGFYLSSSQASIHPGIVHRLDKGTSGLLAAAKDEHSRAHLSEQLKLHAIQTPESILQPCGVPSPFAGLVNLPIGRGLNNWICMVALPGLNYCGTSMSCCQDKVIEILADGASALIRAHAKYMGIPLLRDEVYGGTKSMAFSLLWPRTSPSSHGQISELISGLEKPFLHTLSLGTHTQVRRYTFHAHLLQILLRF
ncbi:hypothetical protein SLEP1_g28254 [Rubroshorea leprosula]|uniref:Pseudouridine synthase RsuA/RluA-like domain-containing protein n=1 Tax=Rubroshorea leprosula TaxID=152421 RepID=A0AAV5K2T3_9ROSI|nr:hypothetical protein SLEP1_g28254 [Rubroshorea leprosula]